MIYYDNGIFMLETKDTSYWFKITEWQHLEHIYYGKKIKRQKSEALTLKRTAMIGSTVSYSQSDLNYSLDTLCLEWSGIGAGDYRKSPISIVGKDGNFESDFIFKDFKIYNGVKKLEFLPYAKYKDKECKTLEIKLAEKHSNIKLIMYYTVFYNSNIIIRKNKIINDEPQIITLEKVMSMMIDIPNRNYEFYTLDGGWIKESHLHKRNIEYGIYENSSTTNSSSNRHNPAIAIAENANENTGNVYGFNIVYSGNHYSCIERSNHDILRIQMGINDYCFKWKLKNKEEFETPEVIMTFSSNGFNKMSHNFHKFINNHIIRKQWQNAERPVLINSWEAYFFDFDQKKLINMAKKASEIGIELFVLDDGWFKNRNDDKRGLGDYEINKKKLPKGLNFLSNKIHELNMSFGLWVEPEMINKDSDLYRLHPEYAVEHLDRDSKLGRNQLVLDLCNKEVRDYIVNNIIKILDEVKIEYIKWDMNRHISDIYSNTKIDRGEFCHRYILGLYEIFKRILDKYPDLLIESCSSGGNRFDLGMLCFSPQIWASDDTDPIERLKIQNGLSYFYPLSAMGAHVSSSPHQQTLRNTPLSTRFNVACFGCLGYELDLKYLSREEVKEIKDQIEFYKKYRNIFQFGKFYRNKCYKTNKVNWQVINKEKDKSLIGFYQTLMEASESNDIMNLDGLDVDTKYEVKTKAQRIFIKKFGGLIKHITPVELNPDGNILRLVNRYYTINECEESYIGYGDLLMQGIKLNNQFIGSYYNNETRLIGDYGSNIYIINAIK